MKSDFYLNWEWRQFGLLMCSWVVWLCYMSLYWILETTPYSVFYVAPTVWLIDLVIVTSSSGTALDSDSARFRPFAAAVRSWCCACWTDKWCCRCWFGCCASTAAGTTGSTAELGQ